MPPLEIPSSPSPPLTAAPPRSGSILPRRSHLPIVVPPRTKMAAAASTLIIMASSPDATARHHDDASSSSGTSSGGSSPSSVTTVTTIESHSSSTQQVPPAVGSRDLIGEYLAAKSRSQGPPAILIPQVAARSAPDAGEDLELAYRHPILLMNNDEEEDDRNVAFCSVVSSVGNERNREVEVRYVDDNSIELLDAREECGEGEKESLIVPKPQKKMAFHSPRGSPVKNGVEEDSKCRLVGKVNPNILKTWEQLSGGDKSTGPARRKNSKNSLITVTSSENSADSKQSCLIFYRNQYNNMAAGEPEEEFHVNRIQHASVSTGSSTTMEDKAEVPPLRTSGSMATSTTETTTSSEGCYDFYDSIDDSSTRIDGGGGRVLEDEDDDEEYGMAAGEGLADFTSLDRKKMMWSIDVEQ